ncbi:MAG: orotate phosphoribosyltransferase [Planctomycetota bacterium]
MIKKKSTSDKERLKRKINKAFLSGNFILSSGGKSNFYFDCRLVTLDQEGAMLSAKMLLDKIRKAKATAVGGITLGADPIVSTIGLLAYQKKYPLKLFYVRKEQKTHGTCRQIEGPQLKTKDKVAVIEDVVTSGRSALVACDAVKKEAACKIVGVFAVLDRLEGGRAAIEAAGYPLHALFTADDFKRKR